MDDRLHLLLDAQTAEALREADEGQPVIELGPAEVELADIVRVRVDFVEKLSRALAQLRLVHRLAPLPQPPDRGGCAFLSRR